MSTKAQMLALFVCVPILVGTAFVLLAFDAPVRRCLLMGFTDGVSFRPFPFRTPGEANVGFSERRLRAQIAGAGMTSYTLCVAAHCSTAQADADAEPPFVATGSSGAQRVPVVVIIQRLERLLT